jgi:hypothetical protein
VFVNASTRLFAQASEDSACDSRGVTFGQRHTRRDSENLTVDRGQDGDNEIKLFLPSVNRLHQEHFTRSTIYAAHGALLSLGWLAAQIELLSPIS